MKKFIFVAAFGAVAACSQSEPAPAPEPSEAAVETVAITAADGGPSTGMYKITLADGTVQMEDVKEDGTYVTTKDGEVVETGKWEQKAPDTYCYTRDEEGAAQICNTETVDANGVWTSTDPEGDVVTVERVVAEAPADATAETAAE